MRFPYLTLALMFLVANGCNAATKSYLVKGIVVFEDGLPAKELAGGVVSFESVADQSNAAGPISATGHFQLTTPGGVNGVPAGRYRVLVLPPEPKDADNPPPSSLPDRYRSYEHSEIEVTVEGKANDIQIRLRRH